MKLGLELMAVFSIAILLTDHRQDIGRHLVNERISIPADKRKGVKEGEEGYWEKTVFEQVTHQINTRGMTRTRMSRSPAQHSTRWMLTHLGLNSGSKHVHILQTLCLFSKSGLTG